MGKKEEIKGLEDKVKQLEAEKALLQKQIATSEEIIALKKRLSELQNQIVWPTIFMTTYPYYRYPSYWYTTTLGNATVSTTYNSGA